MARHFLLIDANVAAAHYAPKSTQSATLQRRARAILTGTAAGYEARILMPSFCIAEVFAVFEKYRWGRTWNRRVSRANTLTPGEFADARRGFGDAIHNATKILQVELNRYHILSVDLVSPINNAYQIKRMRRRGGVPPNRRPPAPASTYDMLIAAMGIWLSQQFGADNLTVITGDGRLASVLNRARSVNLGEPMRAHLTEVAQKLNLTYSPALYPPVIDLVHATRAELNQRLPNWQPTW